MPRPPRIVVLHSSGSGKQPLPEDVEWVPAESADQAVRLLREGSCDGILTRATDPAFGSTRVPIDSRQILGRIATGIAVVATDLRIVWRNPAFTELCAGPADPGVDIHQALASLDDHREEACPFHRCLSGARTATNRLRLSGERHVEVTVQSVELAESAGADADSSEVAATKYLLCLLRDVTPEVKERAKLVAIHRAGLELSHLTAGELAEMTTAERVELLKANIIQYSLDVLNFTNIEVRLLNVETNRLDILISEGMTEPAGNRVLYADLEGNGVTGFVAATGKSFLCDDVRRDPHYIPGVPDACSSLTVPMIYRGRVVGVFNVESPEPSHFKESDCEFLELFAREIAVALNTLDLLQAEKKFGGSASVVAILGAVGIPADEIIADSIHLVERLDDGASGGDSSQREIRRILQNAREIKTAIQQVGRSYDLGSTAPLDANVTPGLLAGRRVLLADADAAVRRSAHQLLARVACEVDTAKDGREALCLCGSVKYDVVMGDIRLSDMNGYEFFTSVRQRLPDTPIVLLTGFGYDASHSIVRARQEGLGGVLYKPFRLDRLCEAIEEALDPKRAARGGLHPSGKQTLF